MKNMKAELPIANPGCAGGSAAASCRVPIKRSGAAAIVNRQSPIGNVCGFTLIELLVVIAIMAILASFTMVVLSGISKTKYRSIASGELAQIENALEDFKAKYGVYPPSNANPGGMLLPPLYYELNGVRQTNEATGKNYVTLDNSARIPVNQVPAVLGVGGFVNCTTGSGEDATPARNFLQGLKQNRIGSVILNQVAFSNLVTSVGGPDVRYTPLGTGIQYVNVNPFRYIYPGTNNPNSYDLYVQLVISGQTNLICNWSKAVIKNSPLP
jgi:prepilin-type N-terminal cleavage/methylation domain-containing protein